MGTPREGVGARSSSGAPEGQGARERSPQHLSEFLGRNSWDVGRGQAQVEKR